MLDRFLRYFVAAMIVLPASTAHAQKIDAIVDSEPITEREIEQRSRLTRLSTQKIPSREKVIDELRKEKLRLDEARKFGVEVSDSEVEQAYAAMARRMRLTPEILTQQLARSGINAETLKHRIRADIAWQRHQRWRRQDPPPRDRDGG